MARTFKIPVRRVSIPRLPQVDPNTPDVFEEMTLQEHLIELRDRIMKVSIGIVLTFIIGFLLQGRIIEEIRLKANATEGLDTLAPTDGLMLSFRVSLYVALAISLPLIVYQFIAFLAPGLTRKEKRIVYISLPFVSILLFTGIAYGYFIAAPRALDFLSNWNSDSMQWSPNGPETLNFFMTLMVGLGLAFQLPVVMFVVAKIGIFTPPMMKKYRKYALVIIMILAAIITPSTDPFNLALVAIPLYVLYELGILISSIFAKSSLRNPDGDAAGAAA
ncbi:MAG TPA: twin-arginine translocase subunit TatC [Thermomicrobiales bacterium]|nr:twin-arginine translocase subunit TatC [Thermomicrobiales bacterium]